MASQSPPKPWERAGGATMTTSPGAATSTANPHISSTTASPSSSSQAPALPAKPSSLTSVVSRTASNYAPYSAASRYNTSPYGGMGSYTSPYSRFGGMGNSMYGGMGGMGGYGSMYGGMGGMYGGMGGYAGQPGMAEDPNSLTNAFSQSTQATFQIIESIVGAFGGFAQMLESTYMATHSSFFAMIAVAEQFSTLRSTLGSLLGIFTLLRYLRTLLARLTGRPPPADATSLTPAAFARFTGAPLPPLLLPDGSPAPPRPSKKPFLVFLLAAFGLPYLMGRFIRALARSQADAHAAAAQGPEGQQDPQQVLDPAQLDFCRVRYDFVPEAGGATPGVDLAVATGDLVAVLDRRDPVGQPSEWWWCRARDGRVGYLPSAYLEVIPRKGRAIGSVAGTEGGEGSVGSVGGSMVVGVGGVGEGMGMGKGGEFYS